MMKTIINSDKKFYASVLEPLVINNLTLPNRIVFPAVQAGYANSDGSVSEKCINFYSRIAQGGCGLIITGNAAISKEAVSHVKIMRLDSDQYIRRLEKLFAEISKFGAIPGIQLAHPGRQTLSSIAGHDLIAPSAIPCPVFSRLDPDYKVREMALVDIKRVQDDFVAAALRAEKAGAKLIELHAAHGYLLNEFLSPHTNHRTDQYGRTPENRTRMITEIILKMREKLANKVAISVRISGNEFLDGGLVPKDFATIIPCLEDAGMDLLNVSVGTVETVGQCIPDFSFGEAPFVNIAAEIKQFTKVPVCAVGAISTLKSAVGVVSSQSIDLVAIGRSQVADPALVGKSVAGEVSKVHKCLKCNKCLYWNTGDVDMHCVVNHSLGEK